MVLSPATADVWGMDFLLSSALEVDENLTQPLHVAWSVADRHKAEGGC